MPQYKHTKEGQEAMRILGLYGLSPEKYHAADSLRTEGFAVDTSVKEAAWLKKVYKEYPEFPSKPTSSLSTTGMFNIGAESKTIPPKSPEQFSFDNLLGYEDRGTAEKAISILKSNRDGIQKDFQKRNHGFRDKYKPFTEREKRQLALIDAVVKLANQDDISQEIINNIKGLLTAYKDKAPPFSSTVKNANIVIALAEGALNKALAASTEKNNVAQYRPSLSK